MHTRRLFLALISLLPTGLCFAQTSWSGTESDSSGNVTLSGSYKLTGDTTLSGANAFIMSGVPSVPSGVVIGTDGNGRILFNQTTVEGSGLVGGGGGATGVSQNLTINNSGTFNANISGSTLELAGTGGTLTNTGSLQANGGGILLLAPSGGAIYNAGGTLSASGASSMVELNATLQGGTLSTSTGGAIETLGTATLDGSTGAGAIKITDGSTYTAGGASSTTTTTNVLGTMNLGTVTGGTLSAGGFLRLTGDETLSGPGSLILVGGQIGTDGNGRLLTVGSSNTIQGYGVIGSSASATGGNPSVSAALQLTNSGTINANVSGNSLTLGGNQGTMTNSGLFEATSGGILIVAPTGGPVNNAGGTITAAGSSSTVEINSTIQGGTLTTSGGALMETVSSATLDGATGSGAVTISNGSTYTSVTNTTTDVRGTLNLGTSGTGGTLSVNGLLRLTGDETLAGPGVVTLASGQIGTDGNGRTLFNQSTIQGQGVIGSSVSGVSPNIVLNNSGTVDANVTSGTLTISSTGGTTTNSGTFEATNGGILVLDPSNGPIVNGGGNISAVGSGSTVQINSTIQGGTLTTSGGALMETVSSATLDGSTVNGAVTISNGSTYTAPTSTTTDVLGTLHLGTSGTGGTLSVNGLLRLTGDETLAGPGVVTMTNGQVGTDGNGRNLFNQSTIQGQGVIGSSVSGVSPNIVLNNSGTVDANVNGGTITISSSGGTTTNSGTFEATNGGILVLEPANGPINNNGGAITANGSGSTVQIAASVQGGTLNTQSGGVMESVGINLATLDGSTANGADTISDGSTYTAATGTQTIVLGTLNLGTVTGGTLALGGNLRLTGDETLVGPGALVMTNGQIGTDGNGRALVNKSTIEGSGVIGSSVSGVSPNIVLNNSGTVDANVNGGTLGIDTTGGAVTNTGTLEATNGGTLVVQPNAPVNNNGGAITANGSGSTVQIAASVQGGTLNTQSGGVVESVGINLATLDGSTGNGADTISDGSTYTAATGTQTTVLGTLNLGTVTGGTLALGGNLRLTGDETLSGPGALVMTNGQIGTDGNGRTLVNNSTIEGSGVIGSNVSGISNNLTITNNGTILANQSGTTLQIAGTTGASNSGTFQANAGSTLLVTSSLGNFSGSTLTGGTYVVNGASGNTGKIQVNSFGNSSAGEIVNTSSAITLNGPNANTLLVDAGGNNALKPLADIQTGGSVTVEGGYSFTTAGALTNAGTVHAGNNGTFTATSGVNSPAVTTGTIQIDSGGAVSIGGGSGTATLTQNGTLALGTNNITVSTAYTNDNFGVGNSFNNHAGVTGTGQILATANSAITLTGAAVTNGGTSTPTLANFGNVHVGQSVTLDYSIENSGTTGPSLIGAIQTGANGGSITSTSLSGTGVTAQNFNSGNPLASQASTGPYTVTYAPTTAGALAGGQTIHIASNFDNVTGPTLTLGSGAAYAYAAVNTLAPVNLGNTHVGQTLSGALSITNTATPSSGYTETLGATLGATTPVATSAGSVNGLGAGGTSNAITVGLNTSTAGALTGTAAVNFTSQAIAASGLSNTSLGTQIVTINGNAYNLASATLGTINLAPVLVGATVNPTLSVTNSGPVGSYTEGLDAAFAGFNGNAGSYLSSTGLGTLTNIAAGNSGNLTFSLNTTSAGVVSGNVLVNLASDGATTSGLGITALTQQQAPVNITINETIANLANPSMATPNPVTLNARVGAASPTQAMTITNISNNGPQEGLNASISTGTTGVTANGSFTSLGAGMTDNSSLVIGINTATAGSRNGTATIALASDGTYNSGKTTSLGTQTITVQGGVYQEAEASTLPTTINLGTLRTGTVVNSTTSPVLGQSAALGLSIKNVAPTSGGYTENLGASFGALSAGLSGSGSPITGLAVGNTSNAMALSFTAGAAGSYSGSAVVNFETEAINNSMLGNLGIGSQTVDVEATINALADGVVQQNGGTYSFSGGANSGTLNFGAITQGSGTVGDALELLNDVTGDADMLTGGYSPALIGPFSYTPGNGATFSLGDMQASDFDISFNTDYSPTGFFSETLTIDENSYNDPQGAMVLTPYELTIEGTINPVGVSNGVPDASATWLLLGLGLASLVLVRRWAF